MFTHNKKYMGKGMYLLNKKFIRKRIEEISGTDKYCHNDWHTFPYSEAEESIVMTDSQNGFEKSKLYL